MTSRTFARSAAVFGAATALTVAGAGAAMATTHESNVDGNTVSVTFELDSDAVIEGDACGAVLTPTAAAAGIAAEFAAADGVADLRGLLNRLLNDENVTVLMNGPLPTVVLGGALGVGVTSGTVTAEDVASNVYALVSYCATDTAPTVNPLLLVGDPMEAVMGSIEMGSSNGGLDTASALLGDGGLDTASALLGGAGGDTGSDIGALLGGGLGDTGSAGAGE